MNSLLEKRVKNMHLQEIDEKIVKLQAGELTDEEQIQLLKEINFSYDILIKFLEEIKIEQLSSEIK